MTIAGPGERWPAAPWPAIAGLALMQRPEVSLPAPGGLVAQFDWSSLESPSLVHLAGPDPYGAAKLDTDGRRSMATLSADADRERTAAAANASVWTSRSMLSILALGSIGQGQDGLAMVDVLHDIGRTSLTASALARRWEDPTGGASRLGARVSAVRDARTTLEADLYGEQHSSHLASVSRVSASADVEQRELDWLVTRAGLRGGIEARGAEQRLAWTPSGALGLSQYRHKVDVLVSARREAGVWMPSGAGVDQPAVHVWQAEIAHRTGWSTSASGGLRRIDTETSEGLEIGDVALFFGALHQRPTGFQLDGAWSPAGRWSAASAALYTSPACGDRRGVRGGLVSTWRSAPDAAIPGLAQGSGPALPPAPAAHLDSGLRAGYGFPMRRERTLVVEGTGWMRVQDSDPEDIAFVASLPAPSFEIAARAEW